VKRPSTLALGPHTIAIAWPAKIKGGLLGRAHRHHNTIEVSKNQARSQQASTLIHEILHTALCDGPASSFAGWNDGVEEAIVLCLEGRLLELFTRPENEPARRWLEGREV